MFSISDFYLCLVFYRNVVQPAMNPYGGVICSFNTYFEFYFLPSTVLDTKETAGHKSQRQIDKQGCRALWKYAGKGGGRAWL